jgi:hypothetical protein
LGYGRLGQGKLFYGKSNIRQIRAQGAARAWLSKLRRAQNALKKNQRRQKTLGKRLATVQP